MLKIRRNVFETNSSSTHSLTIATKEDFEKFKKGELYIHYDELITKDEILNMAKKDEYFKGDLENFDQVLEYYRDEVKTSDQYFDNYYLESFTESYTTKSGDEIVIFGQYGYDG